MHQEELQPFQPSSAEGAKEESTLKKRNAKTIEPGPGKMERKHIQHNHALPRQLALVLLHLRRTTEEAGEADHGKS